MHEVDGRFYRLSVAPAGDKLTVSPYRGKLGSFQVRSGDRELGKLGAVGLLISKDGFHGFGFVKKLIGLRR